MNTKTAESKRKKEEDEDERDNEFIGPVLPPNLVSSEKTFDNDTDEEEEEEDDDDDDEFMIGPLPPTGNFIQVEESRHQKSIQGPSLPKGLQREEWIASLPENSTVARKLGIQVTSFSSKPVSIKEITPVDQDNELDKAVDEYNKATRPEPLVEMHKKKKQKKEPAPTRQLFDFNPEEDLKVKQLDSQQTKSIVEKAKLLNSRFSNPRGQNKFL